MNEGTRQTESVQLAEIEASCLCLSVRQAARVITQLYDEVLQPSGLRTTQFNVLVAIGLAEAVPLTRLAEALVMDRTTLARNLKPLESRGWIAIDKGADRRIRIIRLTEYGRQVLEAALPYWRKAHEQVVARLGQEQSRVLLSDLKAATNLAQSR